MKKKPSGTIKILSDEEVKKVSRILKDSLGISISQKAKKYGIDFEAMVRFHSLAEKIQERRESRHLTIKEVSKRLKVPQYKLKYIEESSLGNLSFKILEDYVKFLELDEWYKDWLNANPQFKTQK